jgi:hypothetical protein
MDAAGQRCAVQRFHRPHEGGFFQWLRDEDIARVETRLRAE